MSDPRSSPTGSATPTPAASSTSSPPPPSWPRSGAARSSNAEGAQELLDEGGDDPEMRDELRSARERIERARGGDPPRDGRDGPERRQERDRRDPRRRRRRRGRPVGRRPVPDALAATPSGSGSRPRRWTRATARTRSRFAATARSRGSSTRAARTACSASRRPSRRAASTPRRRRSRCCRRPRTSRSTIDQNDLEIDVYRSSGPGGQSVNTTDSAVRITHKPTGLVVSMQDEKSQLQNRERAMKVLRARLYEKKVAEQQAELAADRRAQVGTGERAEKIRTYNFPQRRVTDHRVEGLTVHNLDAILGGELDDITGALAGRREAQAARAAGRRLSPLARTTVRDALDSALIALTAAGVRDAAARRRGAARGRDGRRPRGADRRSRPRARAARRRARSRTARGGARSASRSRTSSAARASGGSSSRSTRGC